MHVVEQSQRVAREAEHGWLRLANYYRAGRGDWRTPAEDRGVMWSWAKRLKLERRASVHAVLLAVAGAFVVPAGAAEPPEAAPEIWCELLGIEQAAADYGVDYRISNLQGMRLIVWVDKGNLRLPEFYFIEKQASPDPAEAVTVERQANGAEAVDILLNYRGEGISLGKFRRSYVLNIPISEEELRAQFDWYIQKILERTEPEDGAGLERMLAKGDRYRLIRRDIENKPGIYRIGCEYSSTEPGFWNGRVRSEISVEIYFERTAAERDLELGIRLEEGRKE